uniref:Uncharacterized protein n=1 Tax=Acrobeloides nanus TaxID=290746 RepID=A0A914DAN9_9BILA
MVGAFIIMLKIKNTSIVIQLFLCIMSIHGPLDLFIIGFFIPNHRKFFVKIIRKLCHKNNSNQTEPVFVIPMV